MGGIKIEVPAGEEMGWSEPFELPRCGRTARLREPTVGDFLSAQRAAGSDALSDGTGAALAAGMTELDGKIARYEDIKALKLRDFNTIMERARHLGFLPEV